MLHKAICILQMLSIVLLFGDLVSVVLQNRLRRRLCTMIAMTDANHEIGQPCTHYSTQTLRQMFKTNFMHHVIDVDANSMRVIEEKYPGHAGEDV